MVTGLEQTQVIALGLSAVAAGFDVRTRQIPNVITLGGALAAFVYATFVGGAHAFATSAGGWATGLALFLPFYLLRGMGAGDVKLIACIGSWIGPRAVFDTALYAAIAGGVMAVIVGYASGYLTEALLNVRLLLTHWRASGPRPLDAVTLDRSRGPRLPYALPILAGALVAIWLG
jgi:prepilin peptidase CpaA